MEKQLKEYSHSYFLTAGECSPELEMSVSHVISRIIEVATEHANSWGVGYDRLVKDNEAWVLSRVSLEMKSYPKVNEDYSLITWIENYNRHFSERNIAILDKEGNEIGWARTVWVVINSTTRASVDISKLSYIVDNVSDRVCPIEKQSRLLPVSDGTVERYKFKYCDLDFNRHVNTVRYVEHIMNLWLPDKFEKNIIKRFEIAFVKECTYDMEVELKKSADDNDCRVDVSYEGVAHCKARVVFEPRN